MVSFQRHSITSYHETNTLDGMSLRVAIHIEVRFWCVSLSHTEILVSAHLRVYRHVEPYCFNKSLLVKPLAESTFSNK